MPYINPNVLDNGLVYAKNNASHIYICNAEPATFTAATSTNALGNKNFGAGSVFPTAIADATPSGRKISTAAVTDGNVTAGGSASHWAIVASASSILLAASTLVATVTVSIGNTFTLGSLDVRLPATGG